MVLALYVVVVVMIDMPDKADFPSALHQEITHLVMCDRINFHTVHNSRSR